MHTRARAHWRCYSLFCILFLSFILLSGLSAVSQQAPSAAGTKSGCIHIFTYVYLFLSSRKQKKKEKKKTKNIWLWKRRATIQIKVNFSLNINAVEIWILTAGGSCFFVPGSEIFTELHVAELRLANRDMFLHFTRQISYVWGGQESTSSVIQPLLTPPLYKQALTSSNAAQ